MMQHKILGRIKRGKDGESVATVVYDSHKIKIRIRPDDEPFETTVRLAEDVVKRLKKLDAAAKRIIESELRETYNTGWSSYDEVQKDGSLKTIRNPKLSATAFKKKFSLKEVNVSGSKSVDFYYDDSGLFSGHYVIVGSSNGTDFSDAYAEMWG
ncbi:MAG TPA: DUF2262 domain-containing protein [Gemmataceae bacterium]|nr:DUF2262 domain-containing protein [Gemmataceae bacterium]